MPRRRHPVTRTREEVQYLFRNAIESLEPRTLFNTITGSGTFEYKDATNQIVRVRFQNVQAELVFARVSAQTNEVVLGDATASFDTVNDGKDLFTIYVASAGAGSFISVAQVPATTANVRPMQPFGGGTTLTVFGRDGITSVSTAGGGGSIYLGARTRDTPANIQNENNRPILSDQFFGLGILGPRRTGRLTAGIIVETGVDLGKIFWGGTITGQVTLGGSIDTFYCGALLTGDARGQGLTATPSIPNNFLVTGDIRDLIVMGSIGTHANSNNSEPIYLTGFDMTVGGTVGRVQSYGSIIGNVRATNDPAVGRLHFNQHEIETRVLPGNRGSLTQFEGNDQRDFDFGDPNAVGQPRLGDNQAEFNNDTFDTAQLLGTFNSSKNGNGAIVVNGRLQNLVNIGDELDFYGVPLMAGQTISVELNAPFSVFGGGGGVIQEIASASLQIYDPDNRLVASDSNNIDPEATLNTLFQFTADRPGVYRFAVNATLAGVTLLANINYQLKILRSGHMTIGAISATDEIFGSNAFGIIGQQRQSQFQALAGDLGAVVAGVRIGFNSSIQPFGQPDILADGGNLRVVQAGQLGFLLNGVLQQGPNLGVAQGSIGLIRANSAHGVVDSCVIKDTSSGVGGDLQLMDVPNGTAFINIAADGGIGVIRANDMATDVEGASIITVNADRSRGDGTIDLIDVSGNLGTIGGGGPQITTGPGGNVRYIHVGGTTFRDIFFGGGAPEEITYQPGEVVNFIDDSGTQMRITPSGSRFNPDGTINLDQGALTITQYGIREAGGSVLVNVASTAGVAFLANGQSGRGTAEVSEVNANGVGQLIIEDNRLTPGNQDDDRLVLSNATTGRTLEVTFSGNAVTDVYEVVGGNFTAIRNNTNGEIVNVDAQSIGELVGRTLGFAKTSTGTVVAGDTIFDLTPVSTGPTPDAGPFLQQRTAIRVNGDLLSARSNQGLGNFRVNGTIQELIANADGVGTSGVHEGINGPIMTQPGGSAAAGGGEMRFVNIGEGILPGGTGEVLFSGLYAHSRIKRIENQGEGSDIRGDIIAKGENLPTVQRTQQNGTIILQPVAPIGVISLTDGAIIGSDIFVTLDFENAREINGGPFTTPNYGQFTSDPTFEIEAIGLSGKGGIMSGNFIATDIGNIEVKGGFGIFNTVFSSTAQGDMGNMIADGFGFRTVLFEGGGSLASVIARGNGSRPAVTAYTSSVRYSERMKFDPYSGFVLSHLNDLHLYMGTSKDAPKRLNAEVGRSGLIYDVAGRGARDLGLLSAFQIKASNFTFAAGTGTVVARDTIDQLFITSGRLDSVSTGNDVHNALWSIAGPVGEVNIGGTWRGTSSLTASGPNGQVGSFVTKRSMYGALVSSNDIASVRVGTDFGAPGMLNIDGDTVSAGIDVGRNLNSFVVAGSLLDGSTVFVSEQLGFLGVGGDIQEGTTVSTDTLASQDIQGSVFGEVEIRD